MRAACLDSGRIDAAHPAVIAWAAKRDIDPASLLDLATPTAAKATGLRGRGRPKAVDAAAAVSASPSDYAQPTDVSTLLELPLREVLDRYQSVQGFADWLDIRKSIADTHRVESRNLRDDGQLISRELVKQSVLGLVENQNLRLLENAPRKARIGVLALAEARAPAEEVEAEIRRAISSELTLAKRQVANALKRCKAGDNPPEVTDERMERRRLADRRLTNDIQRRLAELGSREVVDIVRKAIARATSEADKVRFDAALEALPPIAGDVANQIATALASHVTRAITEFNAQEMRE